MINSQPDVLGFVIACAFLCLAAGFIWGYAFCRATTDRKLRKWIRTYPQPEPIRPVKSTVRQVGSTFEKRTPAWRYYI